MRKIAGGVLVLIMGTLMPAAFVKNEDLTPGAGPALLAIGLLATYVWFVTWEPVKLRRHQLVWQPGDREVGPGVRLKPPEAQGKQRLRRESRALAEDIYQYLRTQPAESLERRRRVAAEIGGAPSDSERMDIAVRRMQEDLQSDHLRSQEIAERFGGRLQALIEEYQRRGLLSQTRSSKLEFYAQSHHWLKSLAAELQALADRL